MKSLDVEIIELTPEEALEEEIQQSDEYKEKVYDALIEQSIPEPPHQLQPLQKLGS